MRGIVDGDFVRVDYTDGTFFVGEVISTPSDTGDMWYIKTADGQIAVNPTCALLKCIIQIEKPVEPYQSPEDEAKAQEDALSDFGPRIPDIVKRAPVADVHVCSFSGGVARLTAKQRKDRLSILAALKNDPRISTWDMNKGRPRLWRIIYEMEHEGLIAEMPAEYPWHKFQVSDVGEAVLAGAGEKR